MVQDFAKRGFSEFNQQIEPIRLRSKKDRLYKLWIELDLVIYTQNLKF